MLGWALTVLVFALVAAAFGLGGIAGTVISIAKLIAFVTIVLLVISALARLVAGRRPPAV